MVLALLCIGSNEGAVHADGLEVLDTLALHALTARAKISAVKVSVIQEIFSPL